MTNDSTVIPKQCGKLSVDDQSCLSKTQKKRMKAKMKGISINKGIKNDKDCTDVLNPLGTVPDINQFASHAE